MGRTIKTEAQLQEPCESGIDTGRNVNHAFLRVIETHPGLTLKELDARLKQNRSRLSKIGTQLSSLGLIEKRRDGMHMRFYPKLPDPAPSAAVTPASQSSVPR